MSDRPGVIAGVLIILFLVGIVYAIMEDPFGVFRKPPKPKVPPLKRDPTQPVQVLERHPSAGLEWSRKAYPAQYAPENIAVSEFKGLDDFANERFLDIGGRAYSRELLQDFSYTDPSKKTPRVRVEHVKRGEAFAGRLVGEGLKPNFAYQMKLRGIWEHREAFEKIGYTGRWRLPGRGTNYTDEDYRKFPKKELVEAYILFDYVVSDPSGRVDKGFYLDSSLHVLWSYTHQRAPRLEDTTAMLWRRDGAHPDLYAHPRADLSPQRLFAESQQNFGAPNIRKPVGRAFLPPGDYTCEFVLTEESFHGFGDNGFWATVLSAVVSFAIEDKPKPPPPSWLPSESISANFSMAQAVLEDIEVKSRTDDALEGWSLGGKPRIALAEGARLEAGKRYLFAAEVLTEGDHTWQIYLDDGRGRFEEKPACSIPTSGKKGWQYFEIEITSAAAGRASHFGLAPSTRKGPVGIRKAHLREIRETAESPTPT